MDALSRQKSHSVSRMPGVITRTRPTLARIVGLKAKERADDAEAIALRGDIRDSFARVFYRNADNTDIADYAWDDSFPLVRTLPVSRFSHLLYAYHSASGRV